MKIAKFLLVLTSLLSMIPGHSEVPGYLQQRKFSFAAPGAMGVGLYGYDNPALLNYLIQSDLMFTWTDTTGNVVDFENWGLFFALPKLGYGMIREKNAMGSVIDYRLSTSFGNRTAGFGLGYGWSSGAVRAFERKTVLSLGSLFRPIRQVSFGLTGLFALSGSEREGTAELAIRPTGNELVTLFADYAIQRGIEFKDGSWSGGLAIEPISGVRLIGRYFDDKSFNIGLNISLGRSGLNAQTHFDNEGNPSYSTYGLRMGSYDRSFLSSLLNRNKNYVELNLFGSTKYQRYVMFDKGNTLAGLISDIDAAKKDNSIAGIAINTSGMVMNIELIWELREKLYDFKSTGKHVVIYIDNANTVSYYFASVADKIVMDPMGMLDLRGLLMGRTYLKGTLEKLGIGFDEWRFFKYKSAAETFSRENMSDADREQRQEIIDDIYRVIKTDVGKSRGIAPEKFDELVNNEGFFMAQEALEKGLVDTLGRWEAVKEIVKTVEGKKKSFVQPSTLAQYNLPLDNRWGEKPKIAVIYALGVCAMDDGITARQLVKDVEAATSDRKVKAVVFRVDSPGGDGLASDIIAQALNKCKEKKPVIVSQGLVAGSGGYWLSMNGDKIVAAPVTITGSIGVIGGWLYNNGLNEKLGISTDYVKTGEHADMEFGAVLPFIGAFLPDRNLTEDERARMEREIRTLYKDFVTMVSEARKKDFDEIEAVAQGRVWSGLDGKEIGLVDTLGGLETAITIAKHMAGIPDKDEVEIVQLPRKGLFSLDLFKPKLMGVDIKNQDAIKYLKFRLEHNGKPLPMLPMEYLDMTIQ